MVSEGLFDELNDLYPVGTPILYWSHPGASPVEAKTRSIVWLLGSGHPVVLITGRAGGVSIDAIAKANGEGE